MCSCIYIYIYLRTLYKQKEKMYIAGWHYVPIHRSIRLQTRRNGSNDSRSFDLCTYTWCTCIYRITRCTTPLGDSARRRRWEDREEKKKKKGGKGAKRRGEKERRGRGRGRRLGEGGGEAREEMPT